MDLPLSETRPFRSRTFCRLLVLLGSSGVLLGACAGVPRGASDVHLTQAKSRAAKGAQLFEQHCASCHGDRGQGMTGGPAIMGPGALPELPDETTAGDPQMSNPGQVRTQQLTRVPGAASRDPFRTAADVYRYISTRMPMPARRAGSLPADEYWAILDFVLISHGAEVPEGGASEANAASIAIPH